MGKTVGDCEGKRKMQTRTIEEVLNRHAQELMSIAGVVGLAQSLDDDKPCIKVYVVEKTPELEKKIPRVIHGFPVVVEQTGQMKALPGKQN